ncbi:DUF6778 family protein [uncultured Roseobacter sp.]|uniref:DUF6778 family protein n=1 Tax=uncultured Roseobacter sp. TaxID=114847 RepID=UPI0026045D00|nr:DUF6778 family protein [uncultured Roseobacter sp.]
MRPYKLIAVLTLSIFAAGCSTTDIASRNAPFSNPALEGAVGQKNLLETTFEAAVPIYDVTDVVVNVPENLIVSEANSYYPSGDIVWRGDPAGNRHEQVRAIFETAMARGTAGMTEGTPVILDIEVKRFHALTEKTRYTIGGIHAITFKMSVRSAETGLMLSEPRVIKANLKGFGGERAIAAERQGQTQKVRITDHLAGVIFTELGQPDGYSGQRVSVLAPQDNI